MPLAVKIGFGIYAGQWSMVNGHIRFKCLVTGIIYFWHPLGGYLATVLTFVALTESCFVAPSALNNTKSVDRTTFNPELVTFNPYLVTFNPELVTFNPELVTFNPKLVTFIPELVTFYQN